MAIASLVLGICGSFAWIFPLFGYPVTIVGLVLGLKARKREGGKMAAAGIILSIVFLVVTVINSVLGMIFLAGI